MGGTSADRKARAERMRQDRERVGRRRRNLITGGIVGAVVVLVAVAAIAIGMATGDDGAAEQATEFPTDAIVYDQEAATGEASADDPVDVIVYEDFQCPACAQFDAMTRSLIDDFVRDGTIRVAYRPMNYIDTYLQNASTDYSMRAANAARCVYDTGGGQAFHEFAGLLFDDQQPEGSPGFSEEQYAAYAKQAGVRGIDSCLAKRPHEDAIEKVTRRFATSEVGEQGTPTVLVDGERVADWSPEGLADAIDEAA